MNNPFGNSSGDDTADRRFDYARQMSARGDHADAADLYAQALELAPRWPPLHFNLGEARRRAGFHDDARAAFRSYLSLDPADHMGATLKMALMDGASPGALPESYVRSLFNDYADRFDKALVERLAYRTPAHLAQMIARAAPARAFDRLLDLGCGTGLGAEAAQHMTKHRTGVDLSPGMIVVAKRKKLYDSLHAASIEDFLKQSREHYDLVLCADVFVYIGDLSKIFRDVENSMAENALFAFSVQSAAQEENWILGTDHRYAHSRSYIEECAKNACLDVLCVEDSILRKDGPDDIHGTLYILHRKHRED